MKNSVEEWKDIPGYEGLYQVSSLGRVKSLGNGKTHKTERLLKQSSDTYGYLVVRLCFNGKHKMFKVHRLVAMAFLPNADNLPQINHKSEIKTENFVENLEWCDAKYNLSYGKRLQNISKKLINRKNQSKKVMCVETGEIYLSLNDAERKTGIWANNISCACKGHRGKKIIKCAGGFHWKFV